METNATATKYKVIVRSVKSRDGKQTFFAYKVVDEEDHCKLIDGVICKTVDTAKLEQLQANKKSVITGDISINREGYEYCKAFIRTIDSVEKA